MFFLSPFCFLYVFPSIIFKILIGFLLFEKLLINVNNVDMHLKFEIFSIIDIGSSLILKENT